MNEKRVKKFTYMRQLIFTLNQEKPINGYNESNLTKDIENDITVNRVTLIKKFLDNEEKIIDLLNEDTNKNITLKISNLFNNLNFIEYNNNNKKKI